MSKYGEWRDQDEDGIKRFPIRPSTNYTKEDLLKILKILPEGTVLFERPTILITKEDILKIITHMHDSFLLTETKTMIMDEIYRTLKDKDFSFHKATPSNISKAIFDRYFPEYGGEEEVCKKRSRTKKR